MIRLANFPAIFLSVFVGLSSEILHAQETLDVGLQACITGAMEKNGWQIPQDVTHLKCHGKKIKSLKGLGAYSNIRSLSLHNNLLRKLDVDLSSFTQLTTLNLARNKLKSVTLQSLGLLEKVYLFDNQLTDIHLSGLPKLKVIKVNNNRLKIFSYEYLPALKKIYLFNNKLEHIDIHHFESLEYMDCRENPMSDELYDEMDLISEITFLHDGNAEDW